MADFEGLQRAVEAQVTPPPLDLLRSRHRRRQQRRMTTGALGLALVATVATVVVRDGGPAPRTQTVEVLDRLVSGSQAVPLQDFVFTVTDVEFVSPASGYAIGFTCRDAACQVGVKSTADGGRSWSPEVVITAGLARTVFQQQDPATGAVRSLRFLDAQTGYAFNPGRWMTRDGGRTWLPQLATAKIANVQVEDGVPWFASRPCPPETACTWRLTGPATDPEVAGSELMLRRSDATTATLLAWSRPGVAGETASRMLRTADGGGTWTPVTDPCPAAWGRQLSVTGPEVAWLACAGDDTPELPKQVYRTLDGGRSWQGAGTIGQRGIPTDVAALSADSAYLTLQDTAQLLRTTDGGRSWHPAAGARSHYGFSNLQFLDGKHGFVMGDRGDLWRTSDGVTWTHVALPVGPIS